jgi:hypothetical protein
MVFSFCLFWQEAWVWGSARSLHLLPPGRETARSEPVGSNQQNRDGEKEGPLLEVKKTAQPVALPSFFSLKWRIARARE